MSWNYDMVPYNAINHMIDTSKKIVRQSEPYYNEEGGAISTSKKFGLMG